MLVVVEYVVVVQKTGLLPAVGREQDSSHVPMVERRRGLLALRLGGDGIRPARRGGLHDVAERAVGLGRLGR